MTRRLTCAWIAILLVVSLASPCAFAESIYRWVDDKGVLHLSSEKPPKGVKAERITVQSKPSKSGSAASGRGGKASAEQVAARREVLGSLRLRECVIALEAQDRLTSGTRATDLAELKRLQQTVDRNCSSDPTVRRTQEEMAARLKTANSPSCVQAREQLANMLSSGQTSDPDRIRRQQTFVSDHCTPPVR